MSGALHIDWARLFLHGLAGAGVRDVVLSPGSRSTPLAVAAAMDARLRLHVVVDERSAAFFALGQARVTGRPSVLVCTSGTAGAHYFPAIIEASQSRVPLLAVTADRPWELHDCGAPQTIDQQKLFGSHVRHFAELGLPDPAALRAVPRIAAQAVARALGPTPGPVHVNARFRKPLDPVRDPGPAPWDAQLQALLARAPTAVHAPERAPDPDAVKAVAERLARAERAVIVAGPAPLAQAEDRGAVLELARRAGLPLFAEATSQLRFGGDRAGVVTCSAIDAVLRAAPAPDLILELGAPPTSSAYAEIAAACPARFVVAPHGHGDPHGDALALIQADPGAFARALAAELPPRIGAAPPWAASLARADAHATARIDAAIGDTFGEAEVARALLAACPEGTLLAVGNSTPVRDLDAYVPASARDVRVLSQRGASGIDGLLSGAAGARSVTSAPVALLLGDLSLFHDLSALALAARSPGPFVIVVVQNGGGRIFEQLPIARAADPDLFDRCFTTPVDVRFEHAAAAFGLPYTRVEGRAALDEALASAFAGPRAVLVEAVVPPHGGAALASRVRAALAADRPHVSPPEKAS